MVARGLAEIGTEKHLCGNDAAVKQQYMILLWTITDRSLANDHCSTNPRLLF